MHTGEERQRASTKEKTYIYVNKYTRHKARDAIIYQGGIDQRASRDWYDRGRGRKTSKDKFSGDRRACGHAGRSI
jgi:hypothetical protein